MASATTLQAATQAVQRDAAGDAPNACVFYEQAARSLAADCDAAGAGPECDAMRAKSDEYLARARVLRAQSTLPAAGGGAAPQGRGVDPNAVMGALAAGQQAQGALAAAEKKGGWQMMAGAAGAGALGGAMVIGSVIGAPIMGAVAGASALAYASTRDDGYGETARGVGNATTSGVTRVREANAEYKITDKAAAAATDAAAAAQAVDGKYQVTEKVGGALSWVTKKATEVNTKYDVTGKAASGVGAALDGVSAAGQATSAAAGAPATAQPPTGGGGGGGPGPTAI